MSTLNFAKSFQNFYHTINNLQKRLVGQENLRKIRCTIKNNTTNIYHVNCPFLDKAYSILAYICKMGEKIKTGHIF